MNKLEKMTELLNEYHRDKDFLHRQLEQLHKKLIEDLEELNKEPDV